MLIRPTLVTLCLLAIQGRLEMENFVKDATLAAQGKRNIDLAEQQMPVLAAVAKRYEKEKPLSGVRISACLHVTKETAVLMRTLVAGGASVRLCASNPLSTQDDVAASLAAQFDVTVFAKQGINTAGYYR